MTILALQFAANQKARDLCLVAADVRDRLFGSIMLDGSYTGFIDTRNGSTRRRVGFPSSMTIEGTGEL